MSDRRDHGMPLEDERALELLASRASTGLSAEEEAELRELLAHHDGVGEDYFDLAAAAVELAAIEARAASGAAIEPPPAGLGAKLLADAPRYLPNQQPSKPAAPSTTAAPGGTVTPYARPAAKPPASSGTSLGWWAAAACAVLAAFGWWNALNGPQDGTDPVDPPPLVAEKPLEERVREAADVVLLDWTATEDEAAVEAGGQVAWSNTLQEGYMRLRGLAANDPQASQYQLWIFDATRDERYPVDGGVFDMEATGEALVPIRARLPVLDPKLFAITVEKPGGVVVSDRGRIVLLAQVPEATPAG